MMTPKKLNLAMAVALAMGAGAASAEITVSGYLKNETAFLTDGGQFIGEEKTSLDRSDHHSDTLKFENSARLFINGDLGESSSWHLDLNFIYDTEGVESDYRGHKNYTQNDWLKEAYIDTTWGSTALRIGKQQVVWGTADGIKLLDIINPTDFREFNQNTFEDSRIPIWMVNVDHPVGELGSLQFIVAEHEENKIPGLDKDGDDGHPFTVLGVDSITGEVNGFLGVAPALGKVAQSFNNAAFGGLFDTNDSGAGNPQNGTGGQGNGLTGFSSLSVDGFANQTQQFNDPDGTPNSGDESIRAGGSAGAYSAPGIVALNNIAQNGLSQGDPNGNNYVTNLLSANSTAQTDVTWTPGKPTSAFEYMPNATYATFNSFAGTGRTGNSMRIEYKRDYPSDDNLNWGARFKNTTESGINWSVNYFYHYDANPNVQLSWHDAATGERLQTVLATAGDANGDGVADVADPTGAFGGGTITLDQIPNQFTTSATGRPAAGEAPSVLLRNSAGQYYGAFAPNPTLTRATNPATLRMTESVDRVHSLGGSFDMAIDRFDIPLVLRGEVLYDQDVLLPQVDLRAMAIGDLEHALTMQEHDMFKYVIGLDATVMTNLLISGQFIQFRDQDYKDTKRTCTTQTGTQFDCGTYTGDAPTMHMSNQFQRGEENKEFVSLFFTKPFGSEQQGRWGNITIFEDEGGYWNRFDVEYGLTDRWVLSGELNSYWGDEDSWFGQLENTSNIQVGVKYIFD